MAVGKIGYPVEFVEDVFGESSALADIIKGISEGRPARILIVADMNVVNRTPGLGAKIGRYVNAHDIQLATNPVVISGGEKAKSENLQSVMKVISGMLEARLTKDDCVLAIGGGSILDVVGYAAAQVRGGMKVVRIPTTPSAMLGSAFANFAAVDYLSVKDALRVASQPAGVLVDISFAKTVMDGVWRSGFCEAMRLAAVSDASFLKNLAKLAVGYRERDMAVFAQVVEGSWATRQKKGPSTFGSWATARLESMSGYRLPYGYALAIGLCVDLDYAVAKGILAEKDKAFIRDVLAQSGALDLMINSRHLLNQVENVLLGLDAWSLCPTSVGIEMPAGLGKRHLETEPDRDVYRKVFQEFFVATGA